MSELTTTCFFAKVLYSLTKVSACIQIGWCADSFSPFDFAELIVGISHGDCAVTGPSVDLVFIWEEKSKATNRKGRLILFFNEKLLKFVL